MGAEQFLISTAVEQQKGRGAVDFSVATHSPSSRDTEPRHQKPFPSFILCLRDSGIVSFIGGVEIHQAIYRNYNKHRRADTDKPTFIDYVTT